MNVNQLVWLVMYARGAPGMADERYVVVTVECPRSKTKQKVHVNVRTGISQIGNQVVLCLRCDNPFNVMVPDRTIRGPFPA